MTVIMIRRTLRVYTQQHSPGESAGCGKSSSAVVDTTNTTTAEGRRLSSRCSRRRTTKAAATSLALLALAAAAGSAQPFGARRTVAGNTTTANNDNDNSSTTGDCVFGCWQTSTTSSPSCDAVCQSAYAICDPQEDGGDAAEGRPVCWRTRSVYESVNSSSFAEPTESYSWEFGWMNRIQCTGRSLRCKLWIGRNRATTTVASSSAAANLSCGSNLTEAPSSTKATATTQSVIGHVLIDTDANAVHLDLLDGSNYTISSVRWIGIAEEGRFHGNNDTCTECSFRVVASQTSSLRYGSRHATVHIHPLDQQRIRSGTHLMVHANVCPRAPSKSFANASLAPRVVVGGSTNMTVQQQEEDAEQCPLPSPHRWSAFSSTQHPSRHRAAQQVHQQQLEQSFAILEPWEHHPMQKRRVRRRRESLLPSSLEAVLCPFRCNDDSLPHCSRSCRSAFAYCAGTPAGTAPSIACAAPPLNLPMNRIVRHGGTLECDLWIGLHREERCSVPAAAVNNSIQNPPESLAFSPSNDGAGIGITTERIGKVWVDTSANLVAFETVRHSPSNYALSSVRIHVVSSSSMTSFVAGGGMATLNGSSAQQVWLDPNVRRASVSVADIFPGSYLMVHANACPYSALSSEPHDNGAGSVGGETDAPVADPRMKRPTAHPSEALLCPVPPLAPPSPAEATTNESQYPTTVPSTISAASRLSTADPVSGGGTAAGGGGNGDDRSNGTIDDEDPETEPDNGDAAPQATTDAPTGSAPVPATNSLIPTPRIEPRTSPPVGCRSSRTNRPTPRFSVFVQLPPFPFRHRRKLLPNLCPEPTNSPAPMPWVQESTSSPSRAPSSRRSKTLNPTTDPPFYIKAPTSSVKPSSIPSFSPAPSISFLPSSQPSTSPAPSMISTKIKLSFCHR